MPPVGAAAVAAAAVGGEDDDTQRSPLFWVLLTLGVIAVAVATLLVGKAIFGTPAVEKVAAPTSAD